MLEKFAVPIAIVAAGALIAGALFFVNKDKAVQPGQPSDTVAAEIRGVQKDDHIQGSPNAKVVIVEYSDTECPFCKQYHETLKRIMAEYGPSGEVAWVYRHFPLPQLHPKAPKQAQAAECAASLGGEEAFWKFLNRVYEVTPSNNGLDEAQLPVIAEFAGLDKAAFEKCLASETGKDRVQKDSSEAAAAGARGTPHSIILVGGEQVPVQGAQPYEVVKGLIDTLLEK
jgi:protein-disulfide isomerase